MSHAGRMYQAIMGRGASEVRRARSWGAQHRGEVDVGVDCVRSGTARIDWRESGRRRLAVYGNLVWMALRDRRARSALVGHVRGGW